MNEPGAPYWLCLDLPGLTRVTLNSRHSWRDRHAHHREWYAIVQAAILEKGGVEALPYEPLERAHLTLIRRSSTSAKQTDPDQLLASFKPILDGLVRCGVLQDDNLGVIGWPVCRLEKAPRKGGSMRVEVRSVDEGGLV